MKLKILNCDNCGLCCETQESPPMYADFLPGSTLEDVDCADRDRVRALPPELLQELTAYKNRMLANLKPYHPTYPACLWYNVESKRCKHHDLRPDICRGFRVGSKACLEYRKRGGKS